MNLSERVLGSIHSHFVHSISNSSVNHFDEDLINALAVAVVFVLFISLFVCFLLRLFDDEISPYSTSYNYYTTSNTLHFRQ